MAWFFTGIIWITFNLFFLIWPELWRSENSTRKEFYSLTARILQGYYKILIKRTYFMMKAFWSAKICYTFYFVYKIWIVLNILLLYLWYTFVLYYLGNYCISHYFLIPTLCTYVLCKMKIKFYKIDITKSTSYLIYIFNILESSSFFKQSDLTIHGVGMQKVGLIL